MDVKSKSQKPKVFEHLFAWRYDAEGNKYSRFDEATGEIPAQHRLVLSHEVLKAIVATKAKLGDNQAANFTKDFLRKASRNSNWPASLKERRWTMEQRTGKDEATALARNFVFRPYADGQSEPFPDEWPLPRDFQTHRLQSVTMSVASKQISRLDEPRLMQIAVELRVVETHFALFSPLSRDGYKVVHLDHLQMGIKLRGSEIDGLFLAQFQDVDGALHPVLVTVEAKKHDEYINSSQVVTQVEHAAGLGVTCEQIVPLALRHRAGGMFIFEYQPFPSTVQKETLASDDLKGAADMPGVFYEVSPAVPGLTRNAKRPKTPKRGQTSLMEFVETEPAPDDDEDEEE